jgi:hypothetical protein
VVRLSLGQGWTDEGGLHGPPPRAGAARPSPSHAAEHVPLALILAGAAWGLLALVGAALLEPSPPRSEGTAIVATNLPGDCIFLRVGSPHEGLTRIHLENPEPATTRVDIEWEREYGVQRPAIDRDVSLAPWASQVIEFRTPALGAGVRLLSSSTTLRARLELLREGEAAPEYRPAHGCLGPQAYTGGQADTRGGDG